MAYTTINKSTDYFNTKLYTGNGSASDRTITGVGFQPDFLWNKSRSNAYNHYIFDVLRGTNMISSNTTQEQEDKSPQFSALTSDGFTIRNDAGSLAINTSGVTFANWCWKANGTGSANTDGTASNVTVSANQTSGFSIVQFDATQSRVSVGHGLGSTPDAIIMKETEGSGGWVVGGFGLDWSGYLSLQSTNAFNNDSNDSSGTGRMFTPDGYAPTSSVWSTNGSAFLSGGTKTCIAYCFKSIKGYSKFGSYVGNGNADGTFVYTGFKPAFVMIKDSTSAGLMWNIRDNKRDTFNPNDTVLYPNSSEVENAHGDNDVDWLSNGFKMRSTNGHTNASGDTYIFMAFAEAPLVGSNNVPCTAR